MNLAQMKKDLEYKLFGVTPEGHCVQCKDSFSAANIFTPAGERESRISKLCERCWNKLFGEPR